MLKFFCVIGKAMSDKLSCKGTNLDIFASFCIGVSFLRKDFASSLSKKKIFLNRRQHFETVLSCPSGKETGGQQFCPS